MKFYKVILFSCMFIGFFIDLHAQSLMFGRDLDKIKVDLLTESDIIQLQNDINSKGITIEKFQEFAIEKGMSNLEFSKLKLRLQKLKTIPNQFNSPLLQMNRFKSLDNPIILNDSLNNSYQIDKKLNPLIYGSELFNQTNIGFEVNQNIATPLNYVIGPNDVLNILVYGIQEFNLDIKVSKDGFIQIPNVGQLKIVGLTIEAAREMIKQQMSKTAYSSLTNNNSKLSVTIASIRTIQVSVIGAMRSGKFTVSSFSNVLNVLNEAGGPNDIGSFRNIELIRNNKVQSKIDLYKFMLYGDQKQILTLQDNDVIRIPPYSNRIEIKGHVKRPGIYEIAPKESFKDILEFSGGFDDTAYTSIVKVIQKTDKEKAFKDLYSNEFDKYYPNGGDLIIVSKIIDRFQNRVKLNGAVYRPDTYELSQGMKVADLIRKGDGLKDDAYTGMAQLFRSKPNLVKEIIGINLNKAMAGSTSDNLLLQKEDELFITSILDLRDSFYVTIYGEVHKPGKYQYVDSMSVKDLIVLAGGNTFSANNKVEVSRIYVSDKSNLANNKIANILTTELDENLNFTKGNKDIILQPYDVISITKKVGFTESQIVTISGQVQYAGRYSLTSRVERVSDILKRAGGLIGDAYGKGAFIKRESLRIDTISMILKDSLSKSSIFNQKIENSQNIALDIEKILKKPGSYFDLILSDKDEIIIPKIDNKVSIRGGVLRPITITYHEGIDIGECISAAGGISEKGKRNKAYIVYFNGRSKRTKSFGFIRINPKIEPGSELIIPEGEIRKDPLTSILQYLTIFAQIGTSIATLKLLTK